MDNSTTGLAALPALQLWSLFCQLNPVIYSVNLKSMEFFLQCGQVLTKHLRGKTVSSQGYRIRQTVVRMKFYTAGLDIRGNGCFIAISLYSVEVFTKCVSVLTYLLSSRKDEGFATVQSRLTVWFLWVYGASSEEENLYQAIFRTVGNKVLVLHGNVFLDPSTSC